MCNNPAETRKDSWRPCLKTVACSNVFVHWQLRGADVWRMPKDIRCNLRVVTSCITCDMLQVYLRYPRLLENYGTVPLSRMQDTLVAGARLWGVLKLMAERNGDVQVSARILGGTPS
jgi:hypothetical protein